mmetsp:Transcript_18039/g.44888  ORF Transcript_18039/g.44888 Transcript_18039/m.44888 type:complete len:339 (+) Transcript_18039:231-1247(+)
MNSDTHSTNNKNCNAAIIQECTNNTVECRKKPQLDLKPESKMTETNAPIQQAGNEPDSRKVLFNVATTPSQDRKRRSKHDEDISEVISHIVGRASDVSVASDVSGLTDGEFFKTEDVSSPSVTYSSKNKIFRTTRAPEPPKVSSSVSKLADIQSETTETTSSNSSQGDKPIKKKRSVSFCEVKIRNYERILEVNPSVTSGPAVGLGWNYSPEEDEIYSVQNFEEVREFSRCNSTDELALPRDKREHLLRSWGYTQREIAGSVRTILRSKNQRKQTVQNLHASSYEEFMEKATRKMKHVVLFPIHKRKKVKQCYPSPVHSPTKNMESSALKTILLQPSC